MNPQPDLLPENPAPGDPTLKDAPGTAASTMAITSSDDSGKKSPPPTEGAGENVLLHESPASAALPLSLDSYVTPKSNKRLRKTKDGETSDKPRRPLSAYNYFFKENRAVLLAERDEKLRRAKEHGDAKEEAESGYGFFGTMAKVIAQRWKAISKEELELYKKKAEVDSKRYREEMEGYNLRKRMAAKMADSPKKGKKISKAKALFKKKASKAIREGKNPVVVEDARVLAGIAAPTNLTMQQANMLRFGQSPSLTGGAAAGLGMLPNQLVGMSQQQQLDMETQLMLLQQQRQLEAMGLVTQATRPALLGGVPSQFGLNILGSGTVGVGNGVGGISQQFLFDQASMAAMGYPGAGQAAVAPSVNDYPFATRMDAYAQQQEQEASLLRQQMMASAGVAGPMAPVSAPHDAGYASLLLQLRLQEQEERLRNQAFHLGQGRW